MRVKLAMECALNLHVTQLGILMRYKARLLQTIEMLAVLRTRCSTSWLHRKVSDESLGREETRASAQPWK